VAWLGSAHLELQLRQTRIKPAGGGQRGVGPFLNDAAIVDDQNAVAELHGSKPMRDHDTGAVEHQSLERLLHQSFTLGIE